MDGSLETQTAIDTLSAAVKATFAGTLIAALPVCKAIPLPASALSSSLQALLLYLLLQLPLRHAHGN